MIKKLLLTAATLFMALSASAQNSGGCYWLEQPPAAQPDTASRTTNYAFLSTQNLSLVPIGAAMGHFFLSYPFRGTPDLKCPLNKVPTVNLSYWLEGAQLEPGYSDVYSTNLSGIGFRLQVAGSGGETVPFSLSRRNALLLTFGLRNFNLEFIRTAHHIQTGQVHLNFKVFGKYHDWTAITFIGNSTVSLTTREYFTGCTGDPIIDIPLGKVKASDLPKRQTRRSWLNVVCTGLPAGSKLPVKVYFEGSTNGPGRLRLTPGGATGVEIAVTSNGVKLPFNVGSALNMDWQHSTSDGERYNLPLEAGYERIGNSEVTVGKADGTMNYVIEYN
ncbi:MAG: fimbrial protein [Comamonas testosteroni]|uniref:fimbrial protein n=1 Tax=Comamonas testosteroni TaxID=285 RepID=UPI003D0A0991